jgi:hypothetical protein
VALGKTLRMFDAGPEVVPFGMGGVTLTGEADGGD